MRDHGGNLDLACARFGGRVEEWIDLSTGINRQAYPVGDLPQRVWTALPSRAEIEALHEAARQAYGTSGPLLAVAGAQAAIQMLPHLASPGRARIIAPTYNEYAPLLAAAGWQVEGAVDLDALAGADLAVVVNPNNPDGRIIERRALLTLADGLNGRGGILVIDESFADVAPEISLAGETDRDNVIVLRSFGKFYGLAGLRLGFAIASPRLANRLDTMLGPWAVSGPAIEIGQQALADEEWTRRTRERLGADAMRLDELLAKAGLDIIGGTSLYRLTKSDEASELFDRLGRAGILVRRFSDQPTWLRWGVPPDERAWQRLAECLAAKSR